MTNARKPATRSLLSWSIGLALAAPAAGSFAATAGTEDAARPRASNEIEEVVVTAQRREESLQKSALAIEVFQGDDLRAAGISSADDLSKIAAGAQISGGAISQIYVRGVGDFGVLSTANPAVATSLDGIGISRPQAVAGNFFDLERVELLKGPQGTLYGRNASGGALNLITVQPQLGEFSGYVEASAGNYQQRAVEGAFNVPAGERGALRLSYQVNDRDGYLTDGANDDKHHSLRLQSKFELNDRLTLRTLMGYIHLGGIGEGVVPIPKLPGRTAWTGTASPEAGAAYLAKAAENFAASGGQAPPPFLMANPADSVLFQDIDNYNVSLQLDADLDFATLTVIPGYRGTEARFGVQTSYLYSVGGAYDAAGDRTGGETSDQYSLEVRLAHTSERLKWVAGAYGFREDQTAEWSLHHGLILNMTGGIDLKTTAYAAFGQLTYSLTDALRLTGGLRFMHDQRDASDLTLYGVSPTVLSPSAPSGLPPIPCLPDTGYAPGTRCPLLITTPGFYDSSVNFDRLTWKAGVEFDVAPQSMLFADVSTGFKAGGLNEAVSLVDPSKLSPFDPEVITAFTLGMKNRFYDNRLQLNAEAFYWKYKDMQLSAQSFDGSGNIALQTQNAGRARIAGANVNVIAKPWPNGTFTAGVEYVDSKYQEFRVLAAAMFVPPGRVACDVSAPDGQGLVTIDCSGMPLMRSPEWSGNVGLSQVYDLPAGGDLTFAADLNFASSRYLVADFLESQKADSYASVSASVTYHAPDERWYLSAYGRNLTNEEIYTGGSGHQSAFVMGWSSSSIAPPRTYGARIGYRF